MGFWTRTAQLVRPAAVADGAAPGPEPAWPSLPAIQRVVTTIAPVAERAPFVASLRTHHNPSFLAPLAHVVDPDGPSGRIGGLVTPAAGVQRAAEQELGLLRRWPQELADGPALRSAPEPAPLSPPLSQATPPRAFDHIAQRSADDAPGLPDAPIGAPDVDPGTGALRHLSAGDGAVPVQRSLTAAAVNEPVFRTLPAVSSAGSSAASEHAAAQPSAVTAELIPVRRDVPDVESPGVATAGVEDVAAIAPVQRTVGGDTPSGDETGHSGPEPRSHADPETPVQRTTQVSPSNAPVPMLPDRLPAAPSVMEQAHAPQPAAPAPELAAPAQVQRVPAPASTPVPSRPVPSTPLPTMTAPAASAPAASERVANTTTSSAASPQPAFATAQGTMAQGTTAQRTTAQHALSGPTHPASDPAPHTALHGTSPESVQAPSVQRSAAAPPAKLGLGAPLERTPAHTTRTETMSLQEWAAARAQPPTVQPPTVQRATTPSQPLGPQPAKPAAHHPESASDAPIAASTSHIAIHSATTDAPNPPVAQRLVGEPPQITVQTTASPVAAHGDTETAARTTPGEPTGTPRVQRLAQPTPATAARAAASTHDTGSIAVAAGIAHRDTDGSVAFDPPAAESSVVQRAVDVDELTVDNNATQTTAATQPVATATAAPQAATAGAPNIDDLARRLYDPLAARLKAELRLDRERFGLVTDLHR